MALVAHTHNHTHFFLVLRGGITHHEATRTDDAIHPSIEEQMDANGTTGALSALYRRVESAWPGNYYGVGWVFAAAGVVQVAVAVGMGAWRLLRRRAEGDAGPSHYEAIPSIPEVVVRNQRVAAIAA